MPTLITADTAAEAAARWWADAIGAPTFRMIDDTATGEERRTAAMVEVMQHMLADLHPVSAEQGQRFADALTQIVNDRSHYYRNRLHTDYGPDHALAAAADAAGVNYSRFPWKTNMFIHDDYVVVGAGYGSPLVVIWHMPGRQPPPCHTPRYDDDWNRLPEACGKPRYHDGGHGDWQPDANAEG